MTHPLPPTFPGALKVLMWGTLSLGIVFGRHAHAQVVDEVLENSTLKIGVNAGSYGGAIRNYPHFISFQP